SPSTPTRHRRAIAAPSAPRLIYTAAMTLRTLAVLLAFAAGLALHAQQPLGLNRPPAGFTALFNGKDLTGWRGRQGDYSPYLEAKLSSEEKAAKQAQWNADRDLHWRVDAEKGEIVSD